MAEISEKRGPIEKGEAGWPINPFGIVALIIFFLIIVFLIVRPLVNQNLPKENIVDGQIISPQSGEIVRSNNLKIKLAATDTSKITKVVFWAKTYVDNRWEVIGEDNLVPFEIEWAPPASFKNKAIAITSHLYTKDDSIIKDPGGWREGIIILSP
ncbi:Ig-like domain-containing protein [Candidatus Curtissbacteria bacterium]|nr:Ig-like domain-containing protein [Candidatus Curtissbacteria bacterium]